MQRFCTNCGHAAEPAAKYCVRCGKLVRPLDSTAGPSAGEEHEEGPQRREPAHARERNDDVPPLPSAPSIEWSPELEEALSALKREASEQADRKVDGATSGPSGIGGWLAWFGVTVFLGALASLSQVAVANAGMTPSDYSALVDAIPSTATLMGFERLYNGIMSVLAVTLGYAVFSKKPWAALFGITVLTAALVLGALDSIAILKWLGELDVSFRRVGQFPPAGLTSEAYGQILRQLVVPAIWLAYLFKSRRVRNTFGEVSWTRTGAWLRSLYGG